MTQDRDFKKVVRKRMAKTGESYAAARSRLKPPARYSFENLTPALKEALGRAEQQARHEGTGYIGTDHLVLGAAYGALPGWLGGRTRLDLPEETRVGSDELRPSREAELALESAFQAAKAEGAHAVSIEHLLLGVMSVPAPRGRRVLVQRIAMGANALPVTAERLKQITKQVPPGSVEPPGSGGWGSILPKR